MRPAGCFDAFVIKKLQPCYDMRTLHLKNEVIAISNRLYMSRLRPPVQRHCVVFLNRLILILRDI